MEIALKIHGVSITKDANKTLEKDLVLTTQTIKVNKKDQVVNREVTISGNTCNFALQNIQFTKKMYQPTEVSAEISVFKEGGDWVPIARDVVVSLFKDKKVTLMDIKDVDIDNIPARKVVGNDFYVHNVQVKYKVNYMRIYLNIFSLDKLLTLNNACRTFVGKKLKADILASEIGKYEVVCDKTNNKKLTLTFDADKMQNLSYDSTEHIFPYLVQYNESFYDMLARTTNRWGEFMYYEDGKLNIGCPKIEKTDEKSKETDTTDKSKESSEAKEQMPIFIPTRKSDLEAHKDDTVKVPLFECLSYYNVDEQENGDNSYDCAASYDDNMLSSPIQKDPNSISGNLFCWGGKLDKVVMKKFSSFFKNTKSLPTFATNETVDDLFDLLSQKINVISANNEQDKNYFTDGMKKESPEKYGDHDYDGDKIYSYNPFSEMDSKYNRDKYFDILKNEINAGKDAICINFDTSYPCLKLGDIIQVYSKEYIVTQVDLTSSEPLRLKNDLWVIPDGTIKYSYQVYAIAKQGVKEDGKGGQFYPTVIPAGHVRLAEPQMATVTDAGDPNGAGRVRVMFDWQDIQKDSDKKIDKETKKASSPWLQFTANAGGKDGIMGKHYEDDRVFVGFIDGNVERPYVIGAISNGAGADVHCTTPGGHVFKLKDDKQGISKFLTNMFYPGWGTLSAFIPGMNKFAPFKDAENNLALAGGFELTDNYGLYKISGSTDNRNISIASPWGDVNIDAFTGISISAPNGDISIKGKNVSIEAGNNLSLTSGTNVKYKMLGDGGASGFFEDVAIAASQKVLKKALSLVTIDLSMVRAAFEVLFRPVEGKLLVKSNRYLMLESGKGECEYPVAAYKDDATVQALIKKQADKDVRPGLVLSSGIKEMLSKVKTLGDDINSQYIVKYNLCIDKKKAFEDYLKTEDIARWSSNYDATKPDKKTPKICSSYAELKNTLWKEGKDLLKPADITFEGSYGITVGDVDDIVIKEYDKEYPTLATQAPAKKKEFITSSRKFRRDKIVEKANELRKAIIDLMELQQLPENYVKSYLVFKNVVIPKAFKEAFMKTFVKKNFTDSFFIKPVEEGKKELDVPYGYDANVNEVKFFERKGAILLLEEIGFKNEWRTGVTDPEWVNSNPLIPSLTGPRQLTVARSLEKDDLVDDDKWKNYILSIQAAPKLSADQWKITKELKKTVTEFKENYTNVFSAKSENNSWGEAKKGAILFSSDSNVYRLNNDIAEVPSMRKEYLTREDDPAGDLTIFSFLADLRRGLFDLK